MIGCVIKLRAARPERIILNLVGLLISATHPGNALYGQSAVRPPVILLTEEALGRKSLNNYGSLEITIQTFRSTRPLDLNSRTWRKAHPGGVITIGPRQRKPCLMEGLHYDSGAVELNAATSERVEPDAFIRERIGFNTSSWFRVPGYFYIPKNVPLPAPGLVVLHAWGGPMLFGSERVCGEPVHPILAKCRDGATGGRALADWYASNGYAVVVIDVYHFGSRAPRGINGLPDSYDPRELDEATLNRYIRLLSGPCTSACAS